MNIKVEISRPHYHPSHATAAELSLTKKRDLSVPPHWVANERRIHPGTGHSYAIVMPPRDHELYEVRQPVHIHCDINTFKELFGTTEIKRDTQYKYDIKVNDHMFAALVKVSEGYEFEPTIHFDHIDAETYGINSETFAEV